jgi:23S rRNA (adenine2030-N6)-methyltransferase
MEPGAMLGFTREIESSGIRKILKLEFSILPEDSAITPGCGMLVINPPYQFKDEARPLLDWLWRALSVEGAGGVKIDWLVRE